MSTKMLVKKNGSAYPMSKTQGLSAPAKSTAGTKKNGSGSTKDCPDNWPGSTSTGNAC